jgi:hypothetical protein
VTRSNAESPKKILHRFKKEQTLFGGHDMKWVNKFRDFRHKWRGEPNCHIQRALDQASFQRKGTSTADIQAKQTASSQVLKISQMTKQVQEKLHNLSQQPPAVRKQTDARQETDRDE